MTKISIIVPVYNVEKYLNRCVESILNQTMQDLELILVDDGSTDGSGAKCDAYKKDGRVRVLHKENGGLSSARNAGIDIAKGAFLGFVDSDDYIEPDMYETMYQAIQEEKADICICDLDRFDEKGNYSYDVSREKVKQEVVFAREALEMRLFQAHGGYWSVAWNKLYRRELFEEIRYPEGKLHEDEFVIHELLYRADRIVCLDRIFLHYFMRSESIMGNQTDIRHLDAVDAYMKRADFYMDEMRNPYCAAAILMSGMIVLHRIWEMQPGRENVEIRDMYFRRYRKQMNKLHGKKIGIQRRFFLGVCYLKPEIAYWIQQQLLGWKE